MLLKNTFLKKKCIALNQNGNKIKYMSLCYKNDFSLGLTYTWYMCDYLGDLLQTNMESFQGELRSQNWISLDIPIGFSQPKCGIYKPGLKFDDN